MLDQVDWSLHSWPLTDHKWGGGGIFCGNFSWNRGPWKPCLQVWCRSCYVPLDNGEFPIAKPKDERGFEVQDKSEEWGYKKGRDGDNLITPFQCDLRHFRNLLQRNPVQDLAQDLRVLKLIRRANLDAFWAREPNTVRGNLATCRQGADIAASFGLKAKLFRPLGPFPLNNTFGMEQQ